MKTLNTYYEDHISLNKFVENNYHVLFASKNCAVLVQVFCGICEQNSIVVLSKQIRELVPHAQVIGTSTCGEIMNGMVSGLKTVLSFSVFYHSEIKAAFAARIDQTDYQLGRAIATKLYSKKAKLLILFATGLTVNANHMLKGVQSVNTQIPVAGGNAGDINLYGKGYVFCNEEVTDCGVVGVVIEGERLTVNRHWHLGWQAIGNEMTITNSDGFRVYTIDHIPAYKIYQKYLDVEDVAYIRNGDVFPLILNRNGIEIARPPVFRHEDDSISFIADIYEGEKVRFSYGNIGMIIEENDRLLQLTRRQPAESIFIYSCSGRREFLQESTQLETLPFQKISPTAGFFTYGEFFSTDNTIELMNVTMTIVVLSETAGDKAIIGTEAGVSEDPQEIESCFATLKDNVATRNINVLKALTQLISAVSRELNESTAELVRINEKVQYASLHDSLTGLSNRRFFEQEMCRLETASYDSVGIIICDVDGLKLINDTLGHSCGDAVIKATANILKSVFKSEDGIARIGGDEFSVLLVNKSLAEIEDSCQMIRKAVENDDTVNSALPLSLSIGCSLRSNVDVKIKAVFKEADKRMYREKLLRCLNIHSKLVEKLKKDLEAKVYNPEEHGTRFQDLFVALAIDWGLSPSNVTDLRLFAQFHDIGKVGISDHIFFKPGPLTFEEREGMQGHCEIGYRIARSLTTFLPIADWILTHHEWWNGKGYPLGLEGENIPIECRILAVVDAFEAMTSDRPYRKAMSYDSAVEELNRRANVQFDPQVIKKFNCLLESGEYS